jgi:hypothetical protein
MWWQTCLRGSQPGMRLRMTAGAYVALISATTALAVLAAAPAAAGAASAGAAAGSGGTWGGARRVITPPTNVLGSLISPVSCTSGGYCAAIGSYYSRGSGRQVPYVVTETSGRWSKIKVLDLSALRETNAGAFVQFAACPSAGNCSLIGSYTTDRRGDVAPFTVTETKGRWAKAHPLRGINSPVKFVESLGCTSAGNCVAGGDGPFVVSE